MRKTYLCLLGLLATSKLWAADPSEWQKIRLGGDTMCARGGEYSIYVRPGTSGRMVLDFLGGGACWDAETCAEGSRTFNDRLPENADSYIREFDGIYDHHRSDNPVKDDTHVMIPYCTGDVHWGSRSATYQDSQGRETTVHHNGAVNAKAAIDYVVGRFTSASRVLVTGCSGGSYGSIYWTPYIKQQWPSAQLVQFGDSGAGILTDEFREHGFHRWNIQANAPRWVPGLDPAQVDWQRLDLAKVYSLIAKAYPESRFSQFHAVYDLIQTYFYMVMGGDADLWSGLMRAKMSLIASEVNNFSYYLAPFDGHCTIPYAEFYDVPAKRVPGISPSSWLSQLLNAEMPAPEPCADCDNR